MSKALKINLSVGAILFAFALFVVIVHAPAAFAASCGDLDTNGNTISCDNGSPDLVVNIWGTTNLTIPHVKPGATVTDAAGFTSICPVWFLMIDCVDLTGTTYYQDGMRATAKQLQSLGLPLGMYTYWLTH